MPDPSWPSSPPEVNYLRLAGPGTAGCATTLASAAAWQAVAGTNEAALSVSAANAAMTAADFQGVGGISSTAAVAGLNNSLQLLAGWAQEKSPIAASAVSAYEAAVSSMIPAEISLANRTEQAADVAMNPLVLGALTPAIVALDTEYFGEHWPQNAATGAAYGAALGALTAALAVPPPLSPPGAAATAPAEAAAAVAQAAAQAAGGEAMKESGQFAKLTGEGGGAPAEAVGQIAGAGAMLLQPIQGFAGAAQPLTGLFQAPLQALQGMFGATAPLDEPLTEVSAAEFGGDAASAYPILPGGATAGLGAMSGGQGVGSAGSAPVITGGAGTALPGAGLTSFTRPPTSFPPETGGRPVGLKNGLLSGAGPVSATVNGGPVPVSSGRAGMGGSSKEQGGKPDGALARVLLTPNQSPNPAQQQIPITPGSDVNKFAQR
ncbi:MAG: PPE domain-containing protein [Mycobacterium sp.]